VHSDLRPNSVQFFISHLASWLRTRRFGEPPEPQIIGKTKCFAEKHSVSRLSHLFAQEDPGARKGGKVAKYSVFPMICGSGGSKSRLAKAAGAEPAGQMRDEKLHAVGAQVKMHKTRHVRTTFGS